MGKIQKKRWFTFSGEFHKKNSRRGSSLSDMKRGCGTNRDLQGGRRGELLKAGCNCRHLSPDHRRRGKRELGF